jgi:hypothetical protein
MTGFFALSSLSNSDRLCSNQVVVLESATPLILPEGFNTSITSSLNTPDPFEGFNASISFSLNTSEPSEGFNSPDPFHRNDSDPSAKLDTQSVSKAFTW